MQEIKNSRLDEHYFFIEHESGLPIYIYPKQHYNGTYAVFGTNYGSINTHFKLNGRDISVPDGIAHFLEHKMFENEDGDAFFKYSKTGADANAFTAFDKTCYLFSCTEKFKASLKILLEFVSSPYFTEETINKEQGIIGQEIKMYDDDPSWSMLFNLLKAMYHKHPVKTDIAGTVDSIASITPQNLYDCYSAYYNLNNMVLCVVGNVDYHDVLEIADKVLSKARKNKIESIFPQEPVEIVKSKVEAFFPIKVPMFELGFKENVNSGERISIKDVATTDVIIQCLTSKSSDLYTDLLEKQLINTNSFGAEFFEGPGYASVIFSGESKNPEFAAQIIKQNIADLKARGVASEDFARAKKVVYARTVASLNSIQAIGQVLVNSHFLRENVFDYIEYLSQLDLMDINQRLQKQFVLENSAISIARPLSESYID